MDDKKAPVRKNFDYQERWHGFGSPVGLGIGVALGGLGLLFLAVASYIFASIKYIG